ncbi:MAG: DUF2442 domain-containing protein [Candidatus Sumerlaeota bacterium]|nr:DUF2442 domain-containing protein [Candidatus Sumerlaeota bacterium]
MIFDLVSAEYIDDYKIRAYFENGRSGIVDLRVIIGQGGVFAPLANLDRFRKFRINQELGVLSWGDDVDVAPETLYNLATGEPLPDWMEP